MKRDYPNRPIIAVGVVVIKGDSVLLIKRSKPPKSEAWSIPGGAQEIGETVLDTARREVLEETAITIDTPHFLDIIDYIDQDENNEVKHHYTLIDYAAQYQSGDVSAGDDAIDAKWVSIDDLSEYNLWQETEKIIYSALDKLKDIRHDK